MSCDGLQILYRSNSSQADALEDPYLATRSAMVDLSKPSKGSTKDLALTGEGDLGDSVGDSRGESMGEDGLDDLGLGKP